MASWIRPRRLRCRYTQDDPTDADVEDLFANRLADFAAAATVDMAAPVVLARAIRPTWTVTASIDALHVTFNEAISDATGDG